MADSSFGSTSSISGLVSGMDTASLISQLMKIEARPQTLLKSQLGTAQTVARALREINTSMATLSSAAQVLTAADAFVARTVTSSSKDVAATATQDAQPGNRLTFTVTGLASAQTSMSAATWSSRSGDVRTAAADSAHAAPTWPLTVLAADGTTVVDTIDLPAGASLDDAAVAINKKGVGLTATVLKLDDTHYTLQVTGSATGVKNGFTLRGTDETADTTDPAFGRTAAARDAELMFGSRTATSPTNTFADLFSGVSVTVSQVSATPVTVSVGSDTGAITAKVQALVNAATTALSTLAKYTDSSPGSTAPLKGNPTLTRLASQIRDQLSRAVGGSSPAVTGLQLNRNGAVNFDAGKLGALLQSDAATAQRILGGVTGDGADGITHTQDDTVVTDGIAARLLVLGKQASDSAQGMITAMADGQDTRVKNLQDQMDSWDLRLQLRQQTLERKFQAMESALGTLKSQSAWLASQINALPTWYSNKK